MRVAIAALLLARVLDAIGAWYPHPGKTLNGKQYPIPPSRSKKKLAHRLQEKMAVKQEARDRGEVPAPMTYDNDITRRDMHEEQYQRDKVIWDRVNKIKEQKLKDPAYIAKVEAENEKLKKTLKTRWDKALKNGKAYFLDGADVTDEIGWRPDGEVAINYGNLVGKKPRIDFVGSAIQPGTQPTGLEMGFYPGSMDKIDMGPIEGWASYDGPLKQNSPEAGNFHPVPAGFLRGSHIALIARTSHSPSSISAAIFTGLLVGSGVAFAVFCSCRAALAHRKPLLAVYDQ